jgi:hypothetical protein
VVVSADRNPDSALKRMLTMSAAWVIKSVYTRNNPTSATWCGGAKHRGLRGALVPFEESVDTGYG